MVLLLLALTLFASATPEQTPAQAQSATISGRVMDADTRQPLAGVEVGSRQLGWVTTDNDGRYVTRPVAAGRHEIGIRGYYIASSFAPVAVVLLTNAGASGVDFRVRTEGDVSGQVVDEAGRPMPRVTVMALSRSLTRELVGFETQEFAGIYSPQVEAHILTDEQGRFHLTKVPAGRALFILAYVSRIFPEAIAINAAQPNSPAPIYAATYHPSASTIEQATGVVVHSYEHRSGVVITMRKSPAHCASATLSEATVARPMQFTLQEDEVDRAGMQGGRVTYDYISGTSGADGRIRLCGLPAGRYRLLASARLPSSNERVMRRSINAVGSTSIDITDRDVDGVTVDAKAYREVEGEVVLLDTTGARPVPFTTVQTFPRELAFVRGQPGSSRFTLTLQSNVHYTFLIDTPPPQYYVRDITYAGEGGERSLLSNPFEVVDRDASPRLRITMGADAGRVRARVVAQDTKPVANAWVLLLPAFARTEAELATWAVIGVADELGTFQATGLRPGDYWLIATDDPPPSAVRQPQDTINLDKSPETLGALMKARGRGQRITIAPGGTTEVMTTLSGWR